MKKVVLFTLVIMIFTSCTFIVPCQIKRDFRYCFDGEKTGLDTLININGYYAPDSIIRPSNYWRFNGTIKLVKDTLRPSYMFYDNGFVIQGIARFYYIGSRKSSFFEKRWGIDPGGYRVFGDTIKLQYVNAPGGQSRELVEFWFKIIDRNTIERIPVGNEPLHSASELIYIFRPLEMKPSPEDSWIYKKRWFRCKKK